MNATDQARAAAILQNIAEGVVVERPGYRATSVLACVQCGHRFGIADPTAAEKRTWACKCGGTAKVVGFYARLDKISKTKENPK